MNDLILIHGLKLPVRIGCIPGERDHAQVLEFHITVAVKENDCLSSGNPQDTVCYQTVCDQLQSFTAEREWPLLEQLAEDAAALIFERFTAALEIQFEIRKFVIPAAEWVGIRIARKRE